MTPAELHAALGKGKSPFRPFKLRLTDGRLIFCTDSLCWAISRTGGTFIHSAGDRIAFIAAADITAIEYLD